MINFLAEEELEYKNYTIKCGITALDKGYLILITDQAQYGIGEVVLGTPSMLEGGKPISSPAMIFGIKHNILSKIIAERSSVKFNQPCLVLLHLQQPGIRSDIQTKTVVDCLNKCLDKVTHAQK
ncbi:MAG: hypothetical protein JW776_03075 [Candidatus Lokiarchaeota archaeon]|nr:hypothetical protein [Candidatus Lokiarchaeota archaeon]